ncbi:hypothetical protein SprV_0200725500 [Sparganum proliferum]
MDMKVLKRTGILGIQVVLRQLRLRWSGRLLRMHDERLSKQLYYGDVATGARRQGGQTHRYKDTLKRQLKRLQINPKSWGDLAQDRSAWRRTINTGTTIYEANLSDAAKTKKVTREPRASQSTSPTPNHLQHANAVNENTAHGSASSHIPEPCATTTNNPTCCPHEHPHRHPCANPHDDHPHHT